ncbi:hypothetical protein [Brevibacillus borstelensis]|uniref:hypothetical protein n=1 Tax=Brevibacillus borstelensis TaxID=45462 RepID=UPI00287F75A5|nr:hypothetical protein [Brevibacillus borstelensis]WNF07235.1 hypothetical protein RFB14_07355 [Brevibacillus borstelensis]
MGIGRTWTPDDISYLEDNWGAVSIKHIAKKLGRTVNAVKLKSQRIGLGDPTLHYEGITISQLMKALDKSYSSVYVWIRKYGMPVKEKLFAQAMRVKVISYDDFWKWAEQHKELLNFAKMEQGILGPEPEWAKVKRSADQLRSQKTWQSVAWSEAEDQQLRQLVKLSGMTYPRLAAHFNRTEASIKRRLYDLNIKFRPERLNNHIKYTAEETEQLVSMARQGYGYETIARKLGKSALGVRGKLERMGFDFKRREFKKAVGE